MNRVVDLDAAAAEIELRAGPWTRAGFSVGSITWRDEADGWPRTLKTDRAQVRDPDSVGVTLAKGTQEGEVVLFRGGWCDFVFWTGNTEDDPVQDAPRCVTIDQFGAVLDRLVASFEPL